MVNKITKTKYGYLEPFLTTREKLHLLDISRKIGENHSKVRKHLNDFVKLGILKKETKGRLTLYYLNFDSPIIMDALAVAEKEKLIKKCFENNVLKEIVSELHKLTNKTLIIFGSASDNFPESNDIDILTTEKKLEVRKLSEKFNKKFHLNYLPSLFSASRTFKEEVLKKHLIVNNVEEVVKWLI